MSAQKLLAEADKLLEKGKTAEAVAKVKSAVAAEPANQLIVTKLVELYLNLGKVAEAAQAYVQLAERLSESGKSQVAVAVYKKALEVIPTDFNLRSKYVVECERAGKLGDAYAGAQDLLSYLLPRKKYFEALNIFVLIYRVQARDPSFRSLWLDLLLKTQSEQKLIHFLVALFGPPGIASPEIPNGGDPTEMPGDFYKRAKEIINWFPRDPKAAYSLAWAAYKRGELQEAYRFLRECIRRDPDYTLGYLLFARILAENKFLNECMYVYQQSKDSISLDRSGDPLLIGQQVDAFIEKNGWLSFAVGVDSGDMNPQQFLRSIKGEATSNDESEEDTKPKTNGAGFPTTSKGSNQAYDPTREINVPAEIELNLSESNEVPLEIQNNRSVKEVKLTPTANAAKNMEREEPSVSFTSVIKVDPSELKAKPSIDKALAQEIIAKVEEVISATAPNARKQFNPMDDAATAMIASPIPERQTATIQYNPMDAVRAAGFHKEVASTERPIAPSADLPPPLPPSMPKQEELQMEPPVFVDGERTVLFSPIEAFSAGAESQKNRVVAKPTEQQELAVEPVAFEPEKIVVSPEPELQPIQIEMVAGDRTVVEKIDLPPVEEIEIMRLDREVSKKNPLPPTPDIPMQEAATEPVVEELSIDSGTDLLDAPTKLLIKPVEQLPIQSAVEAKPPVPTSGIDAQSMLKRAEKFLAKQNYYLARKALRHAKLLGADDNLIKEKLKEVRVAELPNSMYAAVSNDGASAGKILTAEDTALLDYLDTGDEGKALSRKGDLDALGAIASLVSSADIQSLLDLGVGFFEMGLYDGAETLFEKIIELEPAAAFNAYYLMGQASMFRGDYAKAVSIFKKLASDHTREEKEKISIYYSLGEALEKMEQSERSRSYFEKVAALDANYRNVKDKING